MYLKALANIVFVKGTASENTKIKVVSYADKRTLWDGKAKELKDWERIGGWIVVEVLIDFGDTEEPADYNKSKIITVI